MAVETFEFNNLPKTTRYFTKDSKDMSYLALYKNPLSPFRSRDSIRIHKYYSFATSKISRTYTDTTILYVFS